MHRIYQSEWQGIQFVDFTTTSSSKLAESTFYDAFYQEFFRRYQDWGDLPEGWLKAKGVCAEFIASRVNHGGPTLSVGSGLGAVEHHLLRLAPSIELFIQEVSPGAWGWIAREIPKNRQLVGHLPSCLPTDVSFLTIYLSTVDYVLDDHELIELLASCRMALKRGAPAECLLISESFQDAACSPSDWIRQRLSPMKRGLAAVADTIQLRKRGQFWGWVRTRAEYRALMSRAGFEHIQDGFVDEVNRLHYWVSGR
jgi:hypothetical protein